jgi:hypothetical protein
MSRRLPLLYRDLVRHPSLYTAPGLVVSGNRDGRGGNTPGKSFDVSTVVLYSPIHCGNKHADSD